MGTVFQKEGGFERIEALFPPKKRIFSAADGKGKSLWGQPSGSSEWLIGYPRKTFFEFYVLYKRSEIFFPGTAFKGFRLVNGKSFQKPAVFLAGELSGFRCIPGPLKSAVVIQAFHVYLKAILVVSQSLQLPIVPSAEEKQGIGIRIELIVITQDRHQSIKALAHIGSSGDQYDL